MTEELARMTTAYNPLDYVHEAARKPLPTEQQMMHQHMIAELEAALSLARAGIYAKAAYHAQGGMAMADSLASLKRGA